MVTVARARATSHRTSRAPGVRLTSALAAATIALLALAGCSSSASTESGADSGAAAGQSEQDGSVAAPAAADAGTDTATDRQVVKTGEIALTVEDPVTAADDVADVVDRFDGRVESQEVQSGVDDEPGWATMTVRVPAESMADAVTALHSVGDVTRYADATQDVTTAARDLDSRIHATELSITRMEELMASATSTSDLLDAEQELSDRQATLESLRSERASLADQVSYSTLTVSLSAPGEAEVETTEGPDSFLDGLAVGWHALVTTLRGLAVALGVVLPWLLLGAALVWAIVVVTGRVRRARPPRPAPAGPQAWPPAPQGRPLAPPPPAPQGRPLAPPPPTPADRAAPEQPTPHEPTP